MILLVLQSHDGMDTGSLRMTVRWGEVTLLSDYLKCVELCLEVDEEQMEFMD